MINLEFDEFKKLCLESGGTKLIPLTLEMEGDLETPISLYKKLCPGANCFLLESVEGGEKWAQYSYIGRNPIMEITALKDTVYIKEDNQTRVKKGDVLEIIQGVLGAYQTLAVINMPDFTGGAVGYLGYDLVKNYENLDGENVDQMSMPDTHLQFFKEVIVYDHLTQKIQIIVNIRPEADFQGVYNRGLTALANIKNEIINGKQDRIVHKPIARVQSRQVSETKETFMAKVEKAQEHIKNGDILQAVLSKRICLETQLEPLEAYRTLRSLNPSPYLFYMDFGPYQLVGSSPELLVKVKGDKVETCPIAGTRPRGKNQEEDDLLAKDLLQDKKELAEHLMLVDLGRNDISKVSNSGTVNVTRLMEIEKYSHVMHIVSHVEGQLKKDCTAFDAIKACLPAGTVSGAPKVRAMEIIDELEDIKRGVYAGAFGYLALNGNIDLCIAIRTIVFKDQKAYLQAGAGIVADSKPEREYQEVMNKMGALLAAISKAESDEGRSKCEGRYL